MVKITNGVNVFEVTRGAFDGIYSRQGYRVIEENKAAHDLDTVAPAETEEQAFLREIVEKPISQWTKDEVKRFAVLNDINISGTKNVGEAKELIKTFLEAQE